MNKKILFLSLLAVLFVPTLTSAVTIQSMVDAAEQTTLYIASGVVVILWVVTGLLFLSASGAPEKLKSARTSLFASVAGTVVVIIAASAISIVTGAFNLT